MYKFTKQSLNKFISFLFLFLNELFLMRQLKMCPNYIDLLNIC